MRRAWFRFRWWLARRIAPRGTFVLRPKSQPWRHDCTLHSSPVRVWGTGWRYVTPDMAEAYGLAERR